PDIETQSSVRLVTQLIDKARQLYAQPLRIAHEDRARRIGAAEPFLRGDGVEVGAGKVNRNRARRLGAVDEERRPVRPSQARQVEPAAGRPEDVRDGDQASSRRYGGEQRVLVRLRHDDAGSSGLQRSEQTEV